MRKGYLTIFFIFVITLNLYSAQDQKCWSSTYDDRRDEESLSKFKAKCSSYSSTRERNGYDIVLTGCGYKESNVSCCCSYKDWPKKAEDVLTDEEKDLPMESKSLLGEVRLIFAEMTSKIKVVSLSEAFKKLMAGDVAAVIGSSLVAGNLTFLTLDKIRTDFLKPMQKSFSKYLGKIGNTELIETLSKTKGFSFGAKVTDKIGFAWGLAIPVLKTQIEDFKNNMSFRKHLSDLSSESFIAFNTIVISTEIGAEIGALYFGGGAIPGAVAGFTVGVAISLLSDGIIKINNKTPADYIRDGFDTIFNCGDERKTLQMLDK